MSSENEDSNDDDLSPFNEEGVLLKAKTELRRRNTHHKRELIYKNTRRGTVFGPQHFTAESLVDENQLRKLSTLNANEFEASNINEKDEQDRLVLENRRRHLLESAGPLRRHLYDLVDSVAFNGFIMTVIILNTAIMCALTYDVVNVRAGWYFQFLDYVFLVIYLMECILKLYVWRLDYFKEAWNLMDFTIVAVNVIDFLMATILDNDVNILNVLGMIRAMRALRALRVLRTVRFLRSLQVIMNTCLESVQSMGAITLVSMLFLYMFAVIGTGLYADVDPKRFGSIISAMLTLFQLLTLDDWFYIYADAVAKDPANGHIFLFLLMYITTEYFIFLNLFVAVLVDNFQLTLEASTEASAESEKKKKSESEDQDDHLDLLLKLGQTRTSYGSISSYEATDTKPIDCYYPGTRYKEQDMKYMSHYLRLLASMEYTGHIIRNQHGTLNKMIDLVQEVILR